MNFIDRDRGIQRVASATGAHPLLVSPVVAQIPNHRSRARRLFMKNSVRIGFVYDVRVMMRANMKLVKRALVHSRNKSFPNTRIATCLQLVRLPVPSVEAANHRNFTRIGRPHGKLRALLAIVVQEMRPEFLVDAIVRSFVEKMKVLTCNQPYLTRRCYRRCHNVLQFSVPDDAKGWTIPTASSGIFL